MNDGGTAGVTPRAGGWAPSLGAPPVPPPAAGTRRLLDWAVSAWAVVLVALAVLLAYEVRQTTALADSAVQTAAAVDRTARLLTPLEGLPVLGVPLADVRERIQAASQDARASRTSMRRTSVVAPLAMLVVALAPAAVYLPLRRRWSRELALLRRALLAGELPSPVREQLARRAAARAGYAELLETSDDPLGDLRAGRLDVLVAGELRRLGLA